MDLDLPLLLLAGVSALLLGVRAARGRQWSWVVVAAIVLAVTVGAYLALDEGAGPIAFGVWSLLALFPSLLGRAMVIALHRQRYQWAVRFGWLAFALHPVRSQRDAVERLRVLAFLERGDTERATRLLARIAAAPGPMALDAKLDLLRLEERWDELERAVLELSDEDVAKNPALVVSGMRAFAELGRRQLLLTWFARHEKRLVPAQLSVLRSIGLLHLFAFSGRRAEVERVLATQLPHLTGELVELWGAVARLGAGEPDATERLQRLLAARDGIVRRAARVFLERREQLEADPLAPGEQRLVDGIARVIEQEDRYLVGDTTRTRPWITWALATINVAVFLVEEALGGSTSPEVLFDLGALWPPAVLEGGEVWRLGAPLFLHFGALHVAMNTLGLLALAPFVERALGRARFLAVYLLSGLAGTSLFVAAVKWAGVEPGLLVGASGCIMGMVGATGAVLLRGYRRERALIARRRFIAVVALLALQTAFDLVTPQVSLFAHSIGALTGFVLAALLAHRVTRAPISRR